MIDDIVQRMRLARRCVVLTGAGISAESGVPTFRGKEGLWGKFRPEELATMDAFMANPNIVWEWYKWRRNLLADVNPNPGHHALAAMEKWFDSFVLVTQNVDGLHRIAGSQDVLELHGNILRNKCVKCSSPFPEHIDINPENIPTCERCGGGIRPDVVWFGEMLDADTINRAFDESARSEIFFSVGTSAIVQPAASLPLEAKQHGATLIEINPEETPLSRIADFRIGKPSGEFLPQLMEAFESKISESDHETGG